MLSCATRLERLSNDAAKINEPSAGTTPGVGNSHLAISLAIAAAQSGRRVYYGTLADLITSLEEASLGGRLSHRLNTLIFPSVLVVDGTRLRSHVSAK